MPSLIMRIGEIQGQKSRALWRRYRTIRRITTISKTKKHSFSTCKDAGRTEIPPGTITVLGIGPAIKSEIDDLCSSLELVR